MGKNDYKRERASAQNRPVGQAQISVPRRSQPLALYAALVVVLVVVVLVAVSVLKSAPRQVTASDSGAAIATITHDLASVPASVLNSVKVGANTVSAPVAVAPGKPLAFSSASSHPGVLYVGAEYCPFCAAQRWALAIALDRFGSFSGLSTTTSSATDSYPNTASLSFKNAKYTSAYLDFRAVETTTNVPNATHTGYTPLQSTTAYEKGLLAKYDASGSIPFLDIANRYVVIGASYSPAYLAGLTASQIASILADPTSPITPVILGAANDITKALCVVTHQRPAAVCTSPAVVHATA